jgi:hypothetical protein
MKNIQLFHSYNYVNEKFIHVNKNIYDTNNKIICTLLNIPDNSDLYTIQVQRILKKKIFSKKTNNKSFYTKHNIKVFLLVNYYILKSYLKQKKCIPQFNLLYKNILGNIIINKNEYIHNVICINKSFNKKISLNNTISNDFNFFSLNDYYLDIHAKKIIEKKNLILTKYTVNGCIIYYDLLKLLIDELITYKNTIIIGNKDQHADFPKIITKLYNVDTNNVYNTIILLDTSIDISKLKYTKIIVCVNKTIKIQIKEIIFLLDKFFKVNLHKYELTNKLFYNIINVCVFRNYSQKLIKINELKIQDNNYINVKHFRIDINLTTSTCSICFNNNINIETHCNHYFCGNCVIKLYKNKLSCPYCRLNININNLTYLVKSKNEIMYVKSNINSKYQYLIKKSIKNEIYIISNNDTKINCLKKLYKFMDIKSNICTINNISNITNINNIYFLDKKEKIDINSISNKLIKNGMKKFNLNFFI